MAPLANSKDSGIPSDPAEPGIGKPDGHAWTNGVEKSAPAEIRTRVPRSGGEGDIHYTTRASPRRRRAHMNVLP